MALVATAICENCSNSFVLNLSECYILPNMLLKQRKQDDQPKSIITWADWIDHISNNCPYCRLKNPPLSALEDREKKLSKLDRQA